MVSTLSLYVSGDSNSNVDKFKSLLVVGDYHTL